MSMLDALSRHSRLVPETAELDVVRRYQPLHVNLSASRITAAAQQPGQEKIVDDAIRWAQKRVGKGGNRRLVAKEAVDRLAVEFVQELCGLVRGDVSVEVDGRLAYKRRQMIDRARALMDQLAEAGADTQRVLLKLPATWEGIEAARKLRDKNGYRCHLTLVFGMHQLAACADAGAALVSPAVGRISDFHRKREGVDSYQPDSDPGVLLTRSMHDYLMAHGYRDTVLMPGMFRGIQQALALTGIERLSLPTKLLDLLEHEPEDAAPRVTAEGAAERAPDKLSLDQKRFAELHKADAAADAKLAAALQNLSWAAVSQENQLCDHISRRQDEAAETSTLALFRIWDYDGDGFIDREEWNGTEEVFNALDRDNNGRISLEEMAIGLGAPYRPPEE